MNSKAIELLFYIISIPEGTYLHILSKKFELSQRRIYYLIEEIKHFISYNDYGTVEKDKSRYKILLKSKDTIKELLKNNDILCNIPYLRRLKMFINIVSKKEIITIKELEENFSVSRTVIKSDLNWIKQNSEYYNINLTLAAFKGVYVKTNEKDIRNALISFLNYVSKKCFLNSLDILALVLTDLEIDKLKKIILFEEDGILKFIPDQLLNYFSICLGVIIFRIRENYFIKNSEISNKNSLEKNFSKQLLEKIIYEKNKFDEKFSEINFLAEIITGIPKIGYPLNDSYKTDLIFFQVLLKKFIKAIEKYLCFPYLEDEELFNGLLQHLYPAYIRMLNFQVIDNPIFDKILESYSIEYNAVKKYIHILERGLKIKFNEVECSYFTLFFAASKKRIKKSEIYIPEVLIVCSAGISTAYLLSTQLENLFPIKIAYICSKKKLMSDLKNMDFDFIISTTDLDDTVDYIKVNSILNEEDIKTLSKYFSMFRKEIKIRPLIEIIKKYSKITDEKKLEVELNEHLNIGKIRKKKGKKAIMLKEILKESLIELNVNAHSKNDVIRLAGDILLKNDLIEERYIQAMIDNVEKNGNYIVIAPGIAMPHARPEEGVKQIGISIITLNKPIVFGHKTNDPVKLVIGLCAVDHETHLKALAELIDMLIKDDSIDYILQATNKSDVLNYLLGGNIND